MNYLATILLLAQAPAPVPNLNPPSQPPAMERPSRPAKEAPIRGFRVFTGAKQCEQVGNRLTCDNGFSTTVK